MPTTNPTTSSTTTAKPNNFPKLHNAMWPGLVGKGSPGAEPAIDLDTMLDFTARASVNGVKFDGVDIFLYAPHVDIDISDDDVDHVREAWIRPHAVDLVDAFGYGPKMLDRVLWMNVALDHARTGLALADVAMLTGYADQAHFTRDVKALTGLPPKILLS